MRVAALAFIAVFIVAKEAKAQDPSDSSLQILFAAGGAKTDRRSDAAANTALKVGYRTNEWLSFYSFNRFGYGAENKRFLTFISLGSQFTLDLGAIAPYARIALAHQHEERASSFKENVFSSLLGYGAGIHHRGGAEAAIGAEFPLTLPGELQVFAAVEASALYFFDPNGPRFYAGGTAGLGINYAL